MNGRWRDPLVGQNVLLGVLAALHLAALAVLVLTEYALEQRLAFLLSWILLNCFWLVLLRRPSVAAAMSLAIIVVGICEQIRRAVTFGIDVIAWFPRELWNASFDDTEEKIMAFLRDRGSAYPTLVDEKGKTAIAYGVGGVPETFFLARNGKVVKHVPGPVDTAVLNENIQLALRA